MSTMVDEEKRLDEQTEAVIPETLKDTSTQDAVVVLPVELQGLSDDDMEKLNKRVTRKVDILLMPALVTLYILNYLDRQNLAASALANIKTDLHLSTQQYNTAIAVLFAGYVSLQVPSNILVAKIKYRGTYICAMCAAWGVISGATGGVQNFVGLCVCRVFLGFVEAAFFPGALFLLSTFYTKTQIAFRMSILYSGSQLGSAFGGLFALAILELDGTHGLPGWRWLFIVEGAFTVGFAIIFATFLPNTPRKMLWLSPVEKECLVYRLERDRATKDLTEKETIRENLVSALCDPKLWLLLACLQCSYIVASINNFYPTVLKGLGFNRTVTLAITIPPWIIAAAAVWINARHSDYKQERWLHIICPFFITIIATIIALSTTKIAPRYVAICLLPGSFYGASVVIISWISTTITGSHLKRAICFALINSTGNTPNIWTSYLYIDSPRFVISFSVYLVAACGLVVVATFTRFYLKKQNEKMDRGESTGKYGPSEVQLAGGFRYVL